MLPGFTKNLLAAVKNIEGVVAAFKSKVRTVERELLGRLSGLESGLESRTKQIDHLESLIKTAETRASSSITTREVEKLKSMNRALRAEVAGIKAEGRNLVGQGEGESDAAWIYRLKEMERRLAAEREGRLLDRSGARKRLEEGERRVRELEREVERGRLRDV